MDTRSKPNVIVFFTDQQRWDTTGVHGNPLELTPNFDWMAQEGTHLYHSFTCQPLCGPARSCLQTGLYATTTGCFTNRQPLPAEARTLAHYYREGGYKTGYIGKWHLASREPVPENQRGGYEHWLASNVLEFSSDAYDTVMYDEDMMAVRLPGYRVDALTDEAIRYINKHQSDPFFLFISYIEPHHQNHLDSHPAPIGYEERYAGRWIPRDLATLGGNAHAALGGYYGMVKRLDEALGRLLDALRSLSLLEDTIILFTSDHGSHFKTRNEEYKRSCHESSIRVPTAAIGPGFRSGGRIRELISLIDLPPTLLDSAGLPVPDAMQGRSVMPLLRRERVSWPQEIFVQISGSQIGRCIRTDRWKYSVTSVGGCPSQDSGADEYTEDCLYDLHADPYELVNLAGIPAFREVAAELRARLIERMVEAGEKAPTVHAAIEREDSQRAVSIEANGRTGRGSKVIYYK